MNSIYGIKQYAERLEFCNKHYMLPTKQQNDILHQKQCLISLFILFYQ